MPTLPMSCSGAASRIVATNCSSRSERLRDQRRADADALGVLVGVVVVEVGDRGEDREALAGGVELAGALADGLAEDRVAVAKLTLQVADLKGVVDPGERARWHRRACSRSRGRRPRRPSGGSSGVAPRAEREHRQAVRAVGEGADRVERGVRGSGRSRSSSTRSGRSVTQSSSVRSSCALLTTSPYPAWARVASISSRPSPGAWTRSKRMWLNSVMSRAGQGTARRGRVSQSLIGR